jgi:glycosyltransferase involved in cell wall biosynthesis
VAKEALVTIITTSYNHKPFLEDYFAGLISQTYGNIELILFDDGSPDDSWTVIDSYLPRLRERFPQLVVERHENMGALRELALAVEAATGDYIGILESDDYYYPEKIERTVRYLQDHPDVGVVHTNYDRLQCGELLRRNRSAWRSHIPTGDVLQELLKGNFLSTPTCCMRADLMKKHVDFRSYHERGYLMGDYPMWLHLARVTKFGYLDESLSVYRHLPESASRSRDPLRVHRFNRSLLEIRRDFLKEFGDSTGTLETVEHELHECLYFGGCENNLRTECRDAYRWLREHNPDTYGSLRHRLRGLSALHPWTWSIARVGQRVHKRMMNAFRRNTSPSA